MKKQSWEESEKRREEKSREEKEKEDQKRESLRRKKIQVREEVGKLRNTQFFQWFVICGPGGLKSRLAKAAGAHFKAKMYKTKQPRTTFGLHFWKLWCRKSARCCGAKHISSQNVQNTSASHHF